MAPSSTIHSIIPALGVSYLSKVNEFYSRPGFAQNWLWPEDTLTHASYGLNEVSILFAVQKQPDKIERSDLYFIVSDVQGIHEFFKSQGLDVPDLIETEYGMLYFSINDPWGHHLVFGEALEASQ